MSKQSAELGPASGAEVVGKKAAYHHGNLRAALIDASLRILDDEGIGALGLRAVAREAGVSQTAPYHHFDSKDGLLAAVATEGFRRIAEAQEQASAVSREPSASSDSTAPGSSKIAALGRVYVRFARENPELFKLMFGAHIQGRARFPKLLAAGDAAYRFIEDATAQRLRELGGHRLSARLAVAAAWSIVHGLSHLLNDRRIVPGENDLPEEEELVESIIHFLDLGIVAFEAGSDQPPEGSSR